MTAAQPKVSVLMSVLDGEEYLAEAMDSILGQDFTDFEFVIVDNASTDRTAEIIASYGDHRIVTITNSETLNLSQSLNRGLVAARGDYVARLDADDIALPGRLRKQAAWLDAHSDVALVATAACEFNDDTPPPGRPYPTPPADHDALMAALSTNSIIAHSSIMFRRQPVVEMGGYPETFTYCMDYLLYFRLASKTRLAALPETLVAIRSHPGQITALPSWRLRREVEAVAAFTEALNYPNLAVPVRAGLKRYRSQTSIRLALIHARMAHPVAAAGWLCRAAFCAPLAFFHVVRNGLCNRLEHTQ